MMKDLGQELKEVRETQKLSIEKVALETRISEKYLIALESGNFSSFPSETYALGFLRRYSRYLDLNDSEIVQKYKNNQMMEIETPVKELIKTPVTMFDYLINQTKFIVWIFSALLISAGIYQYFFYNDKKNIDKKQTVSNINFNIKNYLKESGKIPEEKADSVSFANGIIISLIAKGEGIAFLLEGQEIYIILQDLKYNGLGGGKNQASLTFYPGKQKVLLNELSPSEISFPWLSTKLKVDILGSTPNNIKLKIERLGKNENFDEEYLLNQTNNVIQDKNNSIINPDNFTIKLIAKIIKENYIELYVDGDRKRSGILHTGEILHFEANHSIQMKIGDAGGIEVTVNGKKLPKGKTGQQVNKIIRKVKDPIEQLKYHLEIKDT